MRLILIVLLSIVALATGFIIWNTSLGPGAVWRDLASRPQTTPAAASGGEIPDHLDLSVLDFSIDATARKAQNRPPRLTGMTSADCRLPAASNAQILLIGVYEGDAVSTVALGSQDEETSVVEVVVEPGRRPLYVIVGAAQAVIWRFTGAVERVRQVVLVAAAKADADADAVTPVAPTARIAPRIPRAGRPAVPGGVSGVPADRVAFSDPYACFHIGYEPGTGALPLAEAVVERAVGRRPDIVAGVYSIAAIRIPSARAAQGPGVASPHLRRPAGFDGGMWHEGLFFQPAGVLAIAPETVLSPSPVVPYDVLPSQFGLAQLLASGHLERKDDQLRIIRPIPRFPASLSGAHSVNFRLARGVPMPVGDPGHSCVIDEATGRPIGRPHLCRR